MPVSTDLILQYCAPTLAGIKMGNLFSYKYNSFTELTEHVAQKNTLLNQKGVYFEVLKTNGTKALVYVYRKRQLQERLSCPNVRHFLQKNGYSSLSIGDCLQQLKYNLLSPDFPHEIGIFLGYPLSDITAFILHKGMNYKCSGYWKVYTDTQAAQETFARFAKCTKIYCAKSKEGFDISRLTVAC